jgi:tetratricopeptide (TPR) repeat protein
MTILFTLLSLWYSWISLRTIAHVWRERRPLFDDQVTPHDRAVLDRAAFFLLIPVGVLLHEVGHALAARQVGAEVIAFRWFVFWGYVQHTRVGPLADWWVALAGNLAGVAVGFAALGALTLPIGRAARYLALAFARLQFFYALLFYPVFSYLTGFGDWTVIYGPAFGGRLVLVVGALHVALTAALWLAWRSAAVRRRLVALYAPPEVARLAAIVARDAAECDALNRLGAYYADQGELSLAARSFHEASLCDPEDPRPLINAARIEEARGRHDRAFDLYQRTLALARAPALRAVGHAGLAEAAYRLGRPQESLEHVEAALAHQPDDLELLHLRGTVRARLDDEDGARADLERVAAAAQQPLSGDARRQLSELEARARLRTGP